MVAGRTAGHVVIDGLAWESFVVAMLGGAIRSGTPVAYAAIGETIAERAGIINLGLEGMMLVGAMTAVALRIGTGSWVLGLFGAMAVATVLALLHAYLVVVRGANQIVSGLALTLLGMGLSGFLGRPFVGVRFDGLASLRGPSGRGSSDWLSILGGQDGLALAAMFVAIAGWFLLQRTRFGLAVRAVGEDPAAAYAQGISVVRTRIVAVGIGGALAGLGGAHLSLAYTHLWAEKMTAGQGWIAVGLVIVARWNPIWALVAAYGFGALAILHLQLQASGVTASPYLLAMFPYVAAITALTVTTVLLAGRGHAIPAALAKDLQLFKR